jgi:hypothetical protein
MAITIPIIKKPPDKLRTVKCSFISILKKQKTNFSLVDIKKLETDNIIIEKKIFSAICRTQQIITHTYQFLRLWILRKYKNNQEIPIITQDTIKMAFKTLIKDSCGPKPQGNNLILLEEFTKFYNKKYSKLLTNKDKIDGSCLSQILSYSAVDMITNIENNIRINFISYVKRFVNSSFRKINNEILELAPYGTKVDKRKELNKDLFEIKEDLLNSTLLSNIKYHNWINLHRNNIFPSEYTHSYDFDVKNNPHKYIKNMIYMCLELERLEVKSFQFFPLRTNISPKYCPIDTKSIIEILVDKEALVKLKKNNQQELKDDIEGNKHSLWSHYFDLDNPVFYQKNYSFDYRISTDCLGVSIQLINNDLIEKANDQKHNRKNNKNKMKEICKNMSTIEKTKYKEDIKNKQKIEDVKIKLKNKQISEKMRLSFKKLSKEDQLVEKEKIATAKKLKNKNYVEFPYLEELNNEEKANLNNNNWITVDPGKNNLLYMKNKHGIKLRYTNRNHITKTKRLKYQVLIKNFKDNNEISSVENKLSIYNSKSCDYKTFKKYIRNKNKVNEVLADKYKEKIFRQYKWYGYINRKKTESSLISKIKKTFGKNPIICFGDWSIGKQMRGIISTPNLTLKRKLSEHFRIYNLDEYRTSKLNCKTEEINNNLYLPDKKKQIRKLHSVLTYQTEKNRSGCINRDVNAVNNMIKLVNHYLQNTGSPENNRPERFRRSFKLEEPIKIKASNHCKKSVKLKLRSKSAITL